MFDSDLNNLITELRNTLKGRSNLISKSEIEEVLNRFEDKNKPMVDKNFWTMNNQNKEQGLIPSLINNYNFRKQFTKEELNELDQLRKKEYMKAMREMAKADGIERAKKDFKIRASKN